MLGPIDYIVVGFKGNNFDGSVVEALSEAVDKKIIRIVDLLFIMKDAEGAVIEGEYEDQSKEIKSLISALHYRQDDGMPLLTDDDVASLGEQMPMDSAAGVLVVEHLWAKGIKQALVDADGFLIAYGRIQPEAVETAVEELETASR